jgi:hypothetical protein
MIRCLPKLNPNLMIAAVAFLGRDGRAHEPSDPQTQACLATIPYLSHPHPLPQTTEPLCESTPKLF